MLRVMAAIPDWPYGELVTGHYYYLAWAIQIKKFDDVLSTIFTNKLGAISSITTRVMAIVWR